MLKFVLYVCLLSSLFFAETLSYSFESESETANSVEPMAAMALQDDLFENQNYSDVDVEELIKLHQQLQGIFMSVKFWREIYMVLGLIITVVGSSLNLICIFIFSKSKLFRNSSFPYYVYVISVIDTLNIFMRYLVPQSIETYVRRKLEVEHGKYPNYSN